MGQRKSKAGRSNVSVGQINCCVFYGPEHDPIDSNEFTSIQPKSKKNINKLEDKAVRVGGRNTLVKNLEPMVDKRLNVDPRRIDDHPPSYEDSTEIEKPKVPKNLNLRKNVLSRKNPEFVNE